MTSRIIGPTNIYFLNSDSEQVTLMFDLQQTYSSLQKKKDPVSFSTGLERAKVPWLMMHNRALPHEEMIDVKYSCRGRTGRALKVTSQKVEIE